MSHFQTCVQQSNFRFGAAVRHCRWFLAHPGIWLETPPEVGLNVANVLRTMRLERNPSGNIRRYRLQSSIDR